MMGFDGTTVNDQIRRLITTYHVGSILLTAKNLECTVLFLLLSSSLLRDCFLTLV